MGKPHSNHWRGAPRQAEANTYHALAAVFTHGRRCQETSKGNNLLARRCSSCKASRADGESSADPRRKSTLQILYNMQGASHYFQPERKEKEILAGFSKGKMMEGTDTN